MHPDSSKESTMTSPVLDEKMIEIGGGVRLQVAQAGQGEPLVLVCGTGQDYRLFAPLLPALTETYRVISYNHRGIGDSSRGTDRISAVSLADDLESLLSALNIERAHVLGWSLGSVVAQELALAHPDRVASLVLTTTWGRADAFMVSMLTAIFDPWRRGDRTVALTALGVLFSPELVNSDGFGELVAQMEPLSPSTKTQMATVGEQCDADLAHDALDCLGAISVPTLVIAGEQDLVIPSRHARAVADAIAGARYELFTGPGSSHALLLERTEEFMSLVLEFLSGV
jgi:pimeloyl-ACP methyl ester carboxylesterase